MLMIGRDEFTYLRGQLLDQRHFDPNTIEFGRPPTVRDNAIVTRMVERLSVVEGRTFGGFGWQSGSAPKAFCNSAADDTWRGLHSGVNEVTFFPLHHDLR